MSQNEPVCVSTVAVEDPAVRAALWAVYVAAFGDAETACIQEQLCYSRETFDAALLDPDYRKFVAMDGADPVGFFLCTNDLEKARVAYVNPNRLRKQFPEYEGRIWYYTAIAVRPDRQGRRFTAPLVAAATAFMDEQDALVAFDYSLEKNPMLPEFLTRGMEAAQAKAGLKTRTSTFVPLGGQQYGVIKLS
ncbi:MAG TPA: GNAT family N-acetyltransferase [Candidatus Binatia bacterium]|nr:GNAT family N-acetyltransferase [Candidatus Binatia bacterium]